MTTTISATEAALLPITTDEQLVERVTELLDRANARQVWMLFFDDDAIQLPLLVPISDYPTSPGDDEAPAFASHVAAMMRETDAASVAFVWERYAGADATPADRAWAAAMGEACAEADVRVRGQLLCHRRGVRLLDAAEYA